MDKSLLTVYFCLLFLSQLVAQKHGVRFDHLDINDGLSQNNVLCLQTDAFGQVWVGTLNGLNRYNGKGFDVFKSRRAEGGSMAGSTCLAMAADKKGGVYVLTTHGGLDYYNALSNRFVHLNDSLFGRMAKVRNRWLAFSGEEQLWRYGSGALGVFNVTDSTFIVHELQADIHGMEVMEDGSILLCTEQGLMMAQLREKYIELTHMVNDPCLAVAFDANHVYALFSQRLVMYSRGWKEVRSWTPAAFGVSHFNGTRGLVYHNNHLWMSRMDRMISFSLNDFIVSSFRYHPDDRHGVVGHGFNHMRVDGNGHLWIGSDKQGLNVVDIHKNQFEFLSWPHNEQDDLDIDPIRAIAMDSLKQLYIGFDRTGLGIRTVDGHHRLVTHYLNEQGQKKPLNTIRALHIDRLQTLWIGMEDGICLMKQGESQPKHFSYYSDELWNSRTYAFHALDSDSLVISMPGKIGIVNCRDYSQRVINLNKKAFVSMSSIRAIASNDSLLILGLDYGGLVSVNRTTGAVDLLPPARAGLSDGKVYDLLVDGSTLWAATNSGLNRLNLESLKVEQVFYEDDGLSDNIVYSVKSGANGELWMSTNQGITRLDKASNAMDIYLNNDFFMDDAHFVDAHGRIFFGGYHGVVQFNPQTISPSPPIEVRLGRLSPGNAMAMGDQEVNDEAVFLSGLRDVTLPFKDNSFEVSAMALPNGVPGKVVFSYRLVGWDSQWQIASGPHAALRFTNVSPGSYLLEVKAGNGQARFGPAVQLRITVLPPFYQTLWFKMLLFALVVVLAITVYQLRVLQIKRRNRQLKKIVEEQTADLTAKNQAIQQMSEQLHEADQAKLRFFTNISHEFRTPLTLILGHIDDLDQAPQRIRKSIRNNAMRLLNLINELIDFRKIDQQQMPLKVSTFELNSYVAEVVDAFIDDAAKKGLTLTHVPLPHRLFVWLDREKTYKILFNLLSNAIKYSRQQGVIEVSTTEDDHSFYIHVSDQGIGIHPDEVQDVFKRFYRSDHRTTEGHGIGLALALGLAEVQKGHITVRSKWQEGTVFTVTFNKGKDHFHSGDFGESLVTKITADAPVEPLPSLPAPSNKRLLLVEDDAELRTFLHDLLGQQYHVSVAENGQEALGLCNEQPPHLILTDVMMPLLDGLSLVRALKNNPVTKLIPIILLSARTDMESRVEALELGADDFVEKPFNKEWLLARIKALLAKYDDRPTSDITPNVHGLNKQDVQFWKKAQQLVDRHYMQPDFNAQLLAEKMGVSRSTFYRRFSAITGYNAADYIRKTRLLKAHKLLEDKEKSIQQIASDVGFQSASQFRQSFKAYFGKNPSEV